MLSANLLSPAPPTWSLHALEHDIRSKLPAPPSLPPLSWSLHALVATCSTAPAHHHTHSQLSTILPALPSLPHLPGLSPGPSLPLQRRAASLTLQQRHNLSRLPTLSPPSSPSYLVPVRPGGHMQNQPTTSPPLLTAAHHLPHLPALSPGPCVPLWPHAAPPCPQWC